MENQSAARLGEESLNETPRPQANSTAMLDNLLSARTAHLNMGLSQTREIDSNSMNQFSPDFDERSSLSSFKSKSLNRSEFSKSSLGIVNVDQVSDYYTGFLTDFDKDDDSVSSHGRNSRKSDIEKHLRQCFERDSLGQSSTTNGQYKEKTIPVKSASVSSFDRTSENTANINKMKNILNSVNNYTMGNDQVLENVNSDVDEIENYFKTSYKTAEELDAVFKTSDEDGKKMEAFLKDLRHCQNGQSDFDERLSKSSNFEPLEKSSVKKNNDVDSIFGSQMDSASFQSFGFSSDEFKAHSMNSIMQELEIDEKQAKKIDTTVSDQAVDESLSGVMSGDISIGPERLSMRDYFMQKCHSASELDRNHPMEKCHSVSDLYRKPLEVVKELDENQPFQENARRSISEGIPSDDSTCNWSRIMRGSLCKSSFGVDLNASTSSIVSLSEIAKIIQEQPSSATPRTIIDALYAGGHAKHSKFDRESLGRSYISSQSGISSNHSPPERDTDSSHQLRSVSASSLFTDGICSSVGGIRETSKVVDMNRSLMDRNSLNSCKSLPNPNPVSQQSEFRRTSSAPPMKSTRLSLDDKFVSAHSTPNECKFIPMQAPILDSENSLIRNKSHHWSNHSLQNKNLHTPTDSSVKGSEFELVLTDPSTDGKFELSNGTAKLEFCMAESGLTNANLSSRNFSAFSNSDNECVLAQTPSSSRSSKTRNFDSDHSKTTTETSRNESTLTPGGINQNLSHSSNTSQTLTAQNQKEQGFYRARNHNTFASSSSSLADLKNNSIDTIDIKTNEEYRPIGPITRHRPKVVTSSSTTIENLRDEELPSIKPEVDNSACRFWLSDSENFDRDEHNNSLSTINYTIDTMSDCNDNETSQLSSLSSSMLTEVLSNSSILCDLDRETSRIKLNLDGGGTANVNDHIDAGIHCIGTPVDVVVPVLNKSKYDIIWQISYEVTPVDRTQSSVNSAHICVPHKTFKVPSNRKSNVHLIIIPVIATAIDVTLKIESLFKVKSGIRSVERSSISQIIRVIGEDPQLSVGSTSGVIYFGKLPNGCVKSENILLQNTGHSRLPVKFSIQEHGKAEVYQGHTIIEAGENWSNTINLFALKSTNETSDSPDYEFILADLKIRLNVDSNIINESQSLCIIQLKAHVLPVQLLHSSRCSPLILRKEETSHISSETLDIKNGSKIPLNISASVNIDDENLRSCFEVRPITVSIPPNQLVRFVVSFNTKKCTKQKISADIHLQVEPKGIIFRAPVEVLLAPLSNAVSLEQLNFPKQKNSGANPASCPPSPTSSIASAFGQIQLACDAVCLTWLSVPIHQQKVQSCLIKNCGAHREKLLFQISDNNNCFKLLKNEKDSSFANEIKMSLQPSETKKLSVVLFPLTPQTQAFGRITITRFGQDHNSSTDSSGLPTKRVLPLYGFCGDCDIKFNGLNRDVEDRLWIYPDSETFESAFTTENSGDSTGFMIIVPEQFSGDYIKPNEYILAPNESTVVNFAVNLSAIRIENLLEKQKNKDIVQVANLTLYFGNESTRKRIKRILMKCKKKGVKPSLESEQKLALLAGFSPKCSLSVDQLYDPIESVHLLLDDIHVEQVGVLMERSALESALLDTSPVFNDLNATVREVSIMSPATCLNIVPQSLTLSTSGKSEVLNISNTSSRDTSFHAVYPPELSVNPPKTNIQPHQRVQLSVTYIGPKLQGNYCEQKLIRIISDKCETKISVDIKSEEENQDLLSNLIYSSDYNIVFPQTVTNHKSAVTIKVCNTSQHDVLLTLAHCDEPFCVPSESFHLKKKWYCNFRILFRPQTSGMHHGNVKFSVYYRGELISILTYELSAKAVNPK